RSAGPVSALAGRARGPGGGLTARAHRRRPRPGRPPARPGEGREHPMTRQESPRRASAGVEDWGLEVGARIPRADVAKGARMSLFGEPFTAKCLKSGITVEVGEGQSLLEALLDADIPMDYSCEGGVCGTCV